MKKYIITEGSIDAAVVEKLVANRPDVKTVASSGYSSAIAMANALLLRNEQVILVLDADTENQEAIHEKYAFVTAMLKRVADESQFKIFFMVPSMDATLSKIFEEEGFADATKEEKTKSNRKKYSFLSDLPDKIVERLKYVPSFQELLRFI
ncbi:MAG: toprim domain-containing protein [Cytophagales bacterium]|jgi:hypothetical protein|nr:toprim domain-containing protein [Cytophagales bacterium]